MTIRKRLPEPLPGHPPADALPIIRVATQSGIRARELWRWTTTGLLPFWEIFPVRFVRPADVAAAAAGLAAPVQLATPCQLVSCKPIALTVGQLRKGGAA